MAAKLTIRDVAREAGVHHSTVSRAFRNDPNIPPATRERIQQAAKRIGYRPNPLVAALMVQQRTGRVARVASTLAYVNLFKDLQFWQSVYSYTKFFEGARARAAELGYTLEHFWLRAPGMNPKRLGDIFETRGISGLIIGPVATSSGHLSLPWDKFAAVSHGYTLAKPRLTRVCNNYIDTMMLIIRELRHLGYRRIGLAMWSPVNARGNHGWLAALTMYQHYLDPRHRVEPFIPEKWTEKGFVKWFKKEKPEAIATWDRGIADWLNKLGLKIPGDVGLALTDLNPEVHGRWAGVDQRISLVGATAVDVLVAQLSSNQRGVPAAPQLVLTEGQWHPGPTLRKQNRSPEPLALPRQTRVWAVTPR